MSFDIRALEEASKAAEEARGKVQELMEKRGNIFFQEKECEMVLEEFEFLNESDVVMKQIGPTLVRQELSEAKAKVEDLSKFLGTQRGELDKAVDEQQKAQLAAEKKLQELQASVK